MLKPVFKISKRQVVTMNNFLSKCDNSNHWDYENVREQWWRVCWSAII